MRASAAMRSLKLKVPWPGRRYADHEPRTAHHPIQFESLPDDPQADFALR